MPFDPNPSPVPPDPELRPLLTALRGALEGLRLDRTGPKADALLELAIEASDRLIRRLAEPAPDRPAEEEGRD